MTWETERRVTLHELERRLSEFYAKSKELLMNCDPELCPLFCDITTFVLRTRISLLSLGAEEEEGEE